MNRQSGKAKFSKKEREAVSKGLRTKRHQKNKLFPFLVALLRNATKKGKSKIRVVEKGA
jgi:hypothetical protein